MAQGKKRSFDENTALNAAMQVFWQKGYVGASLSDLTKSMGINKPSLYSTFGNKEALFVKTTECYIETKMKSHFALLYAPGLTLLQRLKHHLMSIVEMQCDAEKTNGCYLVLCQSELIGGGIPERARHVLEQAETMPSQLYTELFNNDAEAIELGLNQHAQANALSLYTLLKGTASMARSGVSKAQLEFTIDRLLAGLGLR